jgi:hypothetical protein
LKLVIDTLDDLVVGASEDPEARLRHLRETQRRVQFEIDQIERKARLRDIDRHRFVSDLSRRFHCCVSCRATSARWKNRFARLRGRFSSGRSKAVTRVAVFWASHWILKTLLKKEDQGVSFMNSSGLILTPSQTERLESIIREVRRIPELESQRDGMDTVRSMVTVLQNEAEKVMRTNQRLSTTLRRLLDARAHAERQRIAGVLRQIRGHAVALAANPPVDTVGLSVDVEIDIESPFRRTFWQEPTRLESIDLTDFAADEPDRMEAFRELAALKRLEWKTMRNNIRDLLEIYDAPTLAELLERHPPESGVIEVLGYLQIARDDGHLVNSTARQTVVIPWGDAGVMVHRRRRRCGDSGRSAAGDICPKRKE